MQRNNPTTQTQNKDQQPIIEDRRIYAQLRPGEKELDALRGVQDALAPQRNGRLIGRDELHLTLIHFGKVAEVFERLRTKTDICREEFDEKLTKYVTKTTALLPAEPIRLEFDRFELFGLKRTALVASFKPSEALNTLHTKLFAALVDFMNDIRVPEPLTFMANDPNFSKAAVCRPHVTLYKGYVGDLPTATLPRTEFETMNVVY